MQEQVPTRSERVGAPFRGKRQNSASSKRADIYENDRVWLQKYFREPPTRHLKLNRDDFRESRSHSTLANEASQVTPTEKCELLPHELRKQLMFNVSRAKGEQSSTMDSLRGVVSHDQSRGRAMIL